MLELEYVDIKERVLDFVRLQIRKTLINVRMGNTTSQSRYTDFGSSTGVSTEHDTFLVTMNCTLGEIGKK